MKKNINKSQLESLIAKCVYDTLSEQRQPRRSNRKQVMNESQLRGYISQIVNEELEDEGFVDYLRGAGKAFGNSVQNGAKRAKNYVGNKAREMGNKAREMGKSMGNAYDSVRNYANSINQAGKNRSAAADMLKIARQIDSIYQNYGDQLTKSQLNTMRSVRSAFNKLAASFSDSSINAVE